MSKNRSHQRQRDADGLTAKDRVYAAFLANHDVTFKEAFDEATNVNPTITRESVNRWLQNAKQDFDARLTWHEAQRNLNEPNSRVPEQIREQWNDEIAKATASDDLSSQIKDADKTDAVPGVKQQPDPFRRQEVERIAVKETTRYFTSKGYIVDSVEKDNVGWDLEAVHGQETLRLEVKGLSGAELSVELTPNEYAKMQEYRGSYQICIVTTALTNPRLAVFVYDDGTQRWSDQDGRKLEIEERVAARCRTV